MYLFKSIWNSKWFPRIFYKKPDGGRDSGVTGYFLIEWKPLVSVGLLRFRAGSREVYHNHAFHALTWWLSGTAVERRILYYLGKNKEVTVGRYYRRSLLPKITPRSLYHRVISEGEGWALTIRGPWQDTWEEIRGQEIVILTHGRKIIDVI